MARGKTDLFISVNDNREMLVADIFQLTVAIIIIIISVFPLLIYKDRIFHFNKINKKVFVLIFIVIIITIFEAIYNYCYFNTSQDNLIRINDLNDYPLNSFFVLLFLFCIATPIFEECVIRGHLYKFAIYFKIPLTFWFTLINLVWAKLHGLESVVQLFFFTSWGVALSYIRHFHRSLWIPIIIHCLNNIIFWGLL